MKTIVYLANSFPEPGEPYVWEEIRELRSRGRRVLPCSFRKTRNSSPERASFAKGTHYLFPLRWRFISRGTLFLLVNIRSIASFVWRATRGPEPVSRRLRTLVHTWLGACLAAQLQEENVGHIHVHHGYFSAWAGMVAAQMLDANFSLTLHGSDLLVRADYLDCKLKNCAFCVTVSEFNRNYIGERYPTVDLTKILVHRLGVDLEFWRPLPQIATRRPFTILSVARLNAVKNHEFLIRAVHALRTAGVQFRCAIAGEGAERHRLEELICELRLEKEIELLGHVPREKLPELYAQADVVVLTSRSEGIPVVAMEAMAMERIVVAPMITGIPELVIDGKTGFLYEPNSLDDFLTKLTEVKTHLKFMGSIRGQARKHVEAKFNRACNLSRFAGDFLRRVDAAAETDNNSNEDPVLQQVQLPV